MNAERQRLEEARDQGTPWRRWGPYLSERQWGTVREDYSGDGTAWDSFPHDHARSRAYKWGEDGIAGFSDDGQRLCWALALWNGRDPIIKERLFGLTNREGNHGEDVKECYFYDDATPTHSWMRYVYKYPQAAYPYDLLVATNRERGRNDREFELLDTGVFDECRYFDVIVEFAKAAPEDLCIRITATNRGPDDARLHVLPHLWFRNTWWLEPNAPRPSVRAGAGVPGARLITADRPGLEPVHLYCEGEPELLFTENETNTQRLWGQTNPQPFVKDAFNNRLVAGQTDSVNPEQVGTKSAAHYVLDVPAGMSASVRLRLCPTKPSRRFKPFEGFDATLDIRRREADEFYREVIPRALSAERAAVMRQALAGMLWSKQYYFYDLDRWLGEHDANPISGGGRACRNREWFHMLNGNIISMPDKWEYPWYAAWDLAFHTLALQLVDPDFAREQIMLMLSERYMHPNGQIPAYEWNFSDVNPPVHAWATVFLHRIASLRGHSDTSFLRAAFDKLALNFNWWINRKDPEGRNLFSGGFLGLDNIGVFDRSAPLPTGGHLHQADGTAWMAFFSHCMLQIAIELAADDPAYEDSVAKYLEHFLWIAGSMDREGDNPDDLWDEEDGFFYDTIMLPDGAAQRLKVRSMVGLLPLMASTVFRRGTLREMPKVEERIRSFTDRHPQLMATIHPILEPGANGTLLLSLLNKQKLERILARMLDESQFLGPFGVRSLSREHADHPFVLRVGENEFRIDYQPAESRTHTFGGNSNWRGPVWLPVNALLIRGLVNLHQYYGDGYTVECPTGSGVRMNLLEVAGEITRRLERTFLPDATGRRPVNGGNTLLDRDPHWKDHVLFYEYFHGDTGEGLGASHQTGWTGIVACLVEFFELVRAPVSVKARGPTRLRPEIEPKPAGHASTKATRRRK